MEDQQKTSPPNKGTEACPDLYLPVCGSILLIITTLTISVQERVAIKILF